MSYIEACTGERVPPLCPRLLNIALIRLRAFLSERGWFFCDSFSSNSHALTWRILSASNAAAMDLNGVIAACYHGRKENDRPFRSGPVAS